MPTASHSDVEATKIDPHTALMQGHDHDGLSERTRHSYGDSVEKSKMEKMITPYLAQHIPQQYNPLGGGRDGQNAPPSTANTKYCYRHRPDLLCRRQADEPSMEQLQDVRCPYDTYFDGY
jgi:F-box/WD-40 domain protein MET30